MTNKTSVKTAAAAFAGLVVASALLGGCGDPKSKAVPMDDEYAGSSGESTSSPSASSSASASASASATGKDTGKYKDGTYSIKGQYGPVGEDSIDVTLKIADGKVADVQVVGHPFTVISKNHQNDFIKAIPGVVEGKPLKGMKVDKVAGASWTSDAFNKALDLARQQASE
ncbi:FMN-binding protein [Bifidobacterium sp. SMB2]|uniref:FMN-binding protein n=1 Tax=Bifidobacterium saimiriisciurei TaxID=2661627 RepID=A0ABX0C8C3_9BIFI|nr:MULTISPECIES: FMN-binding protein [Bifidobacterium]NEG95423.1 FMN-binding protein [Bifidobacterium sp. SMB2]NEH11393.1 FMN-binding protein [Bifidobacterium saimiriisciurei]